MNEWCGPSKVKGKVEDEGGERARKYVTKIKNEDKIRREEETSAARHFDSRHKQGKVWLRLCHL
jgi:hypothetical protein